jgi:hypothetical protein
MSAAIARRHKGYTFCLNPFTLQLGPPELYSLAQTVVRFLPSRHYVYSLRPPHVVSTTDSCVSG